MSESEVVVTFTVAPTQLRAADCQGNDQVPYEVDLGEPLGVRALVDGQCLPGGGSGIDIILCAGRHTLPALGGRSKP